MSIQGPSALYSQGFGTTFEKVEIPVVTNRAPTSADGINPPMPLGKRWIDMSGNQSYSLTSFNSAGGVVTSNWVMDSILINKYPVTPYVVGTVGVGGYQTVQAAVDAAHAAGGGAVYIQPGTYTENLTLYDKVSLVGASPINPFSFAATVVIVGTATPPSSGAIYAQNIVFKDNTNCFSSAAAGSTQFVFQDCGFTLTTAGASLDLPNWTGYIYFLNCTNSIPGFNTTGVADDIVDNSSGTSVITFNGCMFTSASGHTLQTNGALEVFSSYFQVPISIGGSKSLCLVAFGSVLGVLTLSSTGAALIYHCGFHSNAVTSITYSSASPGVLYLDSTSFQTNSGTAIDGAGTGTIYASGLNFANPGTGIAGTLTVVWYQTKLGTTTINGKIDVATAGAAASSGISAAMVTGTTTITTTAVTANSQIYLSVNTLGTVTKPQALYARTITPNTSFVITSADATDTSKVNWWIIN